jgi:hypothetical protein
MRKVPTPDRCVKPMTSPLAAPAKPRKTKTQGFAALGFSDAHGSDDQKLAVTRAKNERPSAETGPVVSVKNGFSSVMLLMPNRKRISSLGR